MPEYKPTKRGSYVRRGLFHRRRKRKPDPIMHKEIIQACNDALRAKGEPINYTEEMHMKAMVKQAQVDRQNKQGNSDVIETQQGE